MNETDGKVGFYLPDVLTMTDYDPFGMALFDRTDNGDRAYRFGFNGQEKTDELYGDANAYDFGARIYDPRLGRFLSVDPITNQFPELTPYQFASNSPIAGIDLEGLEFIFYQTKKVIEGDGNAKIIVTDIVNQPIAGFLNGVPVNIQQLGISVSFVSYNGEWVSIPKGFTPNNLPKDGDDAWDGTYTYYEFADNLKTIVETIGSLNPIKIINSVSAATTKLASLASLRRTAVSKAWKNEVELLKKTGRGTRDWTKAEKEQLLNKGKVDGYHGHHKKPVKDNPELAGDPDNIEFLKSGNSKGGGAKKGSEHWKAHHGDEK